MLNLGSLFFVRRPVGQRSWWLTCLVMLTFLLSIQFATSVNAQENKIKNATSKLSEAARPVDKKNTQEEAPAVFTQGDYRLGAGDIIRVMVFQNPDLTLETRVSESGAITYPLIGSVAVGGFTIAQAERNIADALKAGRFVQQPQVNIVLVQIRGNQVSVLGKVARPGRFPLETTRTRLSEVLASAGGVISSPSVTESGSDVVIVQGVRAGLPYRAEIDVALIFMEGRRDEDIELYPGDVVYVPSAPMFYIYGQVQRPGTYHLRRSMTIHQAMIEAGGLTPRGTERRIRLNRTSEAGKPIVEFPELTDFIRPNDILFINESLF